MPASLHNARTFGGEWESRFFLNWQGIHISPEKQSIPVQVVGYINPEPAGGFVIDFNFYAIARNRFSDFFLDKRKGPFFFPTKFWILVEVTSHL